jgi:hypothetical protein
MKMETFGVVRIIMVGMIGVTLGAGIVGYYADRAVRALKAEINFMRRCIDGNSRKGRI